MSAIAREASRAFCTRTVRAIALILLAAPVACASNVFTCPGENQAAYEGLVDGRADGPICVATDDYYAIRGWGLESWSRDQSRASFAFRGAWPVSRPFHGASFHLLDIPLETGRNGAFRPDGPPVLTQPGAFVEASYGPGDLSNRPLLPISGTWHVLRGGAWGDLVEVEIRNVRFPIIEGHTLEIRRLHWTVRISGSPPPDGGVMCDPRSVDAGICG